MCSCVRLALWVDGQNEHPKTLTTAAFELERSLGRVEVRQSLQDLHTVCLKDLQQGRDRSVTIRMLAKRQFDIGISTACTMRMRN